MDRKNFIEALKRYEGVNVFNPYTDTCEYYDQYKAANVRITNLSKVINSAIERGVDSLWVGRDLGHRGGRRTGLALTDEANLYAASNKWGVELTKATKGELFSERTAANIWDFVYRIEKNIFMWNVFPFHPYEKDSQLTNRSHTAKERDVGMGILESLISLLQPKRIIALGNDAYKSSSKLFPSEKVFKVRHPSYGGQREFFEQLCKLYNLENTER